MTRDDDFIGQLEGYLDEFEGMTPLPDGIRLAIRAELPTTRQIGPLAGLRRYLTMRRPVQVAIVVVTLGAIAFLGYQLLPRGGVGGEPSPSAAASPEPTPLSFSSFIGNALPKGPIVLHSVFALPFRFENPSTLWVADGESAGRVTISNAHGLGPHVWLDFFIVRNAYADPCHLIGRPISPPLGPSVDDFVSVVTGWPGFQTSDVRDVTLGGKSGRHLLLTNEIDTSACDGDRGLQEWTHAGGGEDGGEFGTFGGATQELWVVDVDGTRLVVLMSTNGLPASAEQARQVQKVLDSIQFEPNRGI